VWPLGTTLCLFLLQRFSGPRVASVTCRGFFRPHDNYVCQRGGLLGPCHGLFFVAMASRGRASLCKSSRLFGQHKGAALCLFSFVGAAFRGHALLCFGCSGLFFRASLPSLVQPLRAAQWSVFSCHGLSGATWQHCCHGHLADAATYCLPQTISPKNNDITHIYCYLWLCIFCHPQSCSRCFLRNWAIFARLLGWQCCCTLHACVYPSITFGALVPFFLSIDTSLPSTFVCSGHGYPTVGFALATCTSAFNGCHGFGDHVIWAIPHGITHTSLTMFWNLHMLSPGSLKL